MVGTELRKRDRGDQKVNDQSGKDRKAPQAAAESAKSTKSTKSKTSTVGLIFNVLCIYVSFLTWAVLQERITTTPYGVDNRIFRASMVINAIQSVVSLAVGYVYLRFGKKTGGSIIPNTKVLSHYGVMAVLQGVSNFCGYASLKYVDYLTLLLAKSCKLLPVMLVKVIVYGKRFPLYKYIVVLVISIGVSMFSIFHPTDKTVESKQLGEYMYGMGFLGANLLLDGLYYSNQDHILKEMPEISGPKMMCGLNLTSFVATVVFLLSPFTSQLSEAIDFISAHPQVLYDIVLFGLCGGLGQIFIYHALEQQGILLVVTVTVTRKMFSMLLSVVWFNHRLSLGQWAGIAAVFMGVAFEAYKKS